MMVYIDTLFFINFIFDAEILILLCKIYSKKIPKIRLILSACLGGIISIFAFIPYLEILARSMWSFILLFIMVYVVFAPLNYKGICSRFLSFLAISFLISGATFYFGLSPFFSILLPIPIYFIMCILRKNIKKKKGEVVLEYKGKVIETDGFFDSGNMLLSGGMPVILGNKKVFKELFGRDISIRNINSMSEELEMRIIPFISLGKTGTVLGVKLNKIWVDGKEYNDIVLAYAGDSFSDDLVLHSVMI